MWNLELEIARWTSWKLECGNRAYPGLMLRCSDESDGRNDFSSSVDCVHSCTWWGCWFLKMHLQRHVGRCCTTYSTTAGGSYVVSRDMNTNVEVRSSKKNRLRCIRGGRLSRTVSRCVWGANTNTYFFVMIWKWDCHLQVVCSSKRASDSGVCDDVEIGFSSPCLM